MRNSHSYIRIQLDYDISFLIFTVLLASPPPVEGPGNHPESHLLVVPWNKISPCLVTPNNTYLQLLGPFSNILIILARMSRVEIWKGNWLVGVYPDLAQHARVDIAHKDLANRIQAMSFP